MKVLFALLVSFGGISAYARTCDSISGSFKTVSSPCNYSHDGVVFYPEAYKEISIDYNKNSMVLSVAMTSDNYKLNYIADGNEQPSRPHFEGDKYVANCENNQIHIRGVFISLKHPMITEFAVGSDGSMIYKQSYEGSSFIRVCEMDRF